MQFDKRLNSLPKLVETALYEVPSLKTYAGAFNGTLVFLVFHVSNIKNTII